MNGKNEWYQPWRESHDRRHGMKTVGKLYPKALMYQVACDEAQKRTDETVRALGVLVFVCYAIATLIICAKYL